MLGQNINEIYRAGLDVRAGAATPADSSSQGWSVTTLSGTYERLFNYRTDVKISAGLSGVTDSEHDFKFYFSPRAEIKHTFFRGFNIRGLAYGEDRKSTRLNSSHVAISYAVFCLKKK